MYSCVQVYGLYDSSIGNILNLVGKSCTSASIDPKTTNNDKKIKY